VTVQFDILQPIVQEEADNDGGLVHSSCELQKLGNPSLSAALSSQDLGCDAC
jgi:hypothetical protein